MSYDALNRISQTTDAALGIADYSYDSVDQLNNVSDPMTLNTIYKVNTLGEQNQLASPDSGTTNRTFDSAGNVSKATDARGLAVSFTWDALNRLLTISYPTTGENITYTWDAAAGCTNGIGHICQMTDADGTSAFAYDNQGNRIQKTRTEFGVNYVTQYTYDAANRLFTVTTPTVETESLTRDAAGFVQQVTNTDALGTTTIASNIQYNGSGQVTSDLLGNGVTLAMSYSLSGQNYYEPASPVVDTSDNDVPTLPEWGEIFLGSTLLLLTMRAGARTRRRGRDQA